MNTLRQERRVVVIDYIDNNGDIICLLLTCKKLYSNSSLRRSIRFKGIAPINDPPQVSRMLCMSGKVYKSERFIATATQFKLLSFKDILENSISDHQVILNVLDDDDDYPQWVQQRIYAENRVADKSGITTVLVLVRTDLSPTQPESLYDIPSIETLFISCRCNAVVDLGSISLLPCLQRLSISTGKLEISRHHTSLRSLDLNFTIMRGGQFSCRLIDLGLTKFVSLTELTISTYFAMDIGAGLLPSSLKSLTLGLTEIPPRDTFISLTSLVTLDIKLEISSREAGDQQLFIDLESLCNLETLKANVTYHRREPDPKHNISMSVPPSIKILDFGDLCSDRLQIPTHCTMPLLERLDVDGTLVVGGRINLSSSPLIKKLVLLDCYEPMPSDIIPSSVERLTIHSYPEGERILRQVVLPTSLTHLTIVGDHYEPVQHPPSLVKLKQLINDAPLSLPQHLKKLALEINKDNVTHLVLPSSPSYPPNLEALDLVDSQGAFTIDIPPITKYLSIYLDSERKVYSISTRIPENIITEQQQWFPSNTTHLTCKLKGDEGSFRLDQVINHTNVRYLTLCLSDYSTTTFEFSIQRLDANNLNVLVLETKTLQGGIITQQRKSANNQQQQPFQSIYVHYRTGTVTPFTLKWSFSKKKSLKIIMIGKEINDQQQQYDPINLHLSTTVPSCVHLHFNQLDSNHY
ncbi:hypothetical protein DFA_08415 [Cavenderia fasciculata]|uniref:FNIP repeat-containing protein n=1 Tax=Cavenderia fasciculata TaxID=261658 RepID=F4Q611_CACFS|nr:uncharacterized protein DFA_08415 [Cavenderia fasciculata]EGG17420.1 hypothetical protein DFA_08415 [Cavenderia fasciculata]|eukprot:XP_004355904.1 hypothetical protein DFA_08415 [Cavenderia fasciculata]